MARVEWIKLDVDVFQNPKIKRIRREEYGEFKLLIWIMLLTTAGRCNEGGLLKMGDGLPYEIEDLADEFSMDSEIVRSAIDSFIKYGLVEEVNGCYGLPGWEEHQNEDKMEEMREYYREAKRRSRERMKSKDVKDKSKTMSKTSQRQVLDCPDTDIDTDTDKEKDKENISISYPIMASSRHYQALKQPRTISLSISADALEEAERELAMEEAKREMERMVQG